MDGFNLCKFMKNLLTILFLTVAITCFAGQNPVLQTIYTTGTLAQADAHIGTNAIPFATPAQTAAGTSTTLAVNPYDIGQTFWTYADLTNNLATNGVTAYSAISGSAATAGTANALSYQDSTNCWFVASWGSSTGVFGSKAYPLNNFSNAIVQLAANPATLGNGLIKTFPGDVVLMVQCWLTNNQVVMIVSDPSTTISNITAGCKGFYQLYTNSTLTVNGGRLAENATSASFFCPIGTNNTLNIWNTIDMPAHDFIYQHNGVGVFGTAQFLTIDVENNLIIPSSAGADFTYLDKLGVGAEGNSIERIRNCLFVWNDGGYSPIKNNGNHLHWLLENDVFEDVNFSGLGNTFPIVNVVSATSSADIFNCSAISYAGATNQLINVTSGGTVILHSPFGLSSQWNNDGASTIQLAYLDVGNSGSTNYTGTFIGQGPTLSNVPSSSVSVDTTMSSTPTVNAYGQTNYFLSVTNITALSTIRGIHYVPSMTFSNHNTGYMLGTNVLGMPIMWAVSTNIITY